MNIHQFNAFSGADRVVAKPIHFRQNFLLSIGALSKTLNKNSSCKDWSFKSFIKGNFPRNIKSTSFNTFIMVKKKKKKEMKMSRNKKKIEVSF